MLHAVKRKVARVQQPLKSAPNAEFADLKQRLSSIKCSLKYTSAKLSAANRHWVILMQDQRQFSERFHESYPTTTDDTYHVAKQFAEGSQLLYDRFTRETEDDVTAYNDIHKQVILFIKEIETVEAMYPKLADAKSESVRYQAKLDSMERSKRQADEVKKARNLQKMDSERDLYKKLLAETVKAQKETYLKHPIVFKAALTSYWLSHEKHVTLLVQSLEKTQEFAKNAEQEMRELDIAKWTPPEVCEEDQTVQKKGSRLIAKSSTVPDDEEEPEQFHSASTIPVDSVLAEDTGTELVESPTNVIDISSTNPLVLPKESGKGAVHRVVNDETEKDTKILA